MFLEKLVESLMLKRRQFSFDEYFCSWLTIVHGRIAGPEIQANLALSLVYT
jgi:hypothetical protein